MALHHRSHRAVEDEDALREKRSEQICAHGRTAYSIDPDTPGPKDPAYTAR
jgi:hypothetical protein